MTTTAFIRGAPRSAWSMGILAMVLAGCGSTGDISGKVRFKGVALSGGQVTFTSPDGDRVSGYSWIGTDGSYAIRACPTGSVKITVLALERSRGGKGLASKGGAVGSSRSAQPRKPLVLPLRYADPKTTDLEYAVASGPQQHNIDLKP